MEINPDNWDSISGSPSNARSQSHQIRSIVNWHKPATIIVSCWTRLRYIRILATSAYKMINRSQVPWSHHWQHSPADTWRRNDVVWTSMRRNYVASTSVRHHFDVMCLLGLFWNSHADILMKTATQTASILCWNLSACTKDIKTTTTRVSAVTDCDSYTKTLEALQIFPSRHLYVMCPLGRRASSHKHMPKCINTS